MIFSRANFGTFFTSLAIQACGVITGILTARILSPSGRGELATILLWPIILSNLGLMGCNWALARGVAKNPRTEPDQVCSAVAVGLGASFAYFMLGYFLIPLVLPADRASLLPLARLCLLLIPLDIFNQILLAIEHGRMRWRRFNFVRGSFYFFYLILICMIWSGHEAQVRRFVWAFLASQLLAVLLRFWIQRKSFAQGHPSLAECRRLLRSGLPYWGATAGNLFALQIDTVLVVTLMNAEAAGIYAVASAFGNAQFSLGDALGITSFAALSNEKNVGSQQKILTETFRQSTLLSAGLALMFSCLIPFVVAPFFGSAFSQATLPAVILALAAALTASGNILNQGLRGAGRPYAGLASQLLGTAVLALAAALLLKPFGLAGMAWAVALGAGAQIIILVAAAANWLQISPLSFWPFGLNNIRNFFQQVAALRPRILRSPG
ncbi:MAG: oligosaccharide flippase family protein [Acidobacteriia bacterium]|nr:oligosaccharide flippase family protein [Terriglobia bacterium]